MLAIVVALLASLTLISVTVDAYDFIRGQETIIHARLQRLGFLLAELALVIASLIFLARSRGRPSERGLLRRRE